MMQLASALVLTCHHLIFVECSDYGSIRINVTESVDILTHVSGFCCDDNPLVEVCVAGRNAAQNAKALHRLWIQQNFHFLLSNTTVSMADLMRMTTVCVHKIKPIPSACGCIKQLVLNRLDEPHLPLMWKGIEHSTNNPFLLLVLRQWTPCNSFLYFSDLGRISIVFLIFNASDSARNKNYSRRNVISVKLRHCWLTNPCLTPSLSSTQHDELCSNVSLRTIASLLSTRKIRINGEMWHIQDNWIGVAFVASRFKYAVLQRKQVLLFCLSYIDIVVWMVYLHHSLPPQVVIGCCLVTALCVLCICAL